jgi:glutamate synthase domain-containing protein 1
MCGIAGIMYKRPGGGNTGKDLINMLDGCQHRGPDSTGFALYGDGHDGELLLRFMIATDDGGSRISCATMTAKSSMKRSRAAISARG